MSDTTPDAGSPDRREHRPGARGVPGAAVDGRLERGSTRAPHSAEPTGSAPDRASRRTSARSGRDTAAHRHTRSRSQPASARSADRPIHTGTGAHRGGPASFRPGGAVGPAPRPFTLRGVAASALLTVAVPVVIAVHAAPAFVVVAGLIALVGVVSRATLETRGDPGGWRDRGGPRGDPVTCTAEDDRSGG